MIPVLDTNAWIEKLRELERPGADNILAFYEHRFGAICRDPRLMLAPLDDHLVHRGDGVFETIRFTERKVIHIDIDPAEIGKIREANVPIVGDARAFWAASWPSSRNRALRLSMPNGSKR